MSSPNAKVIRKRKKNKLYEGLLELYIIHRQIKMMQFLFDAYMSWQITRNGKGIMVVHLDQGTSVN